MAGNPGNIKTPSWYTGGLANALGPGVGQVFYVNGGSDGPTDNDYSGLRPDRPKQTLQAGIDLCTPENNDCVVVLNYGGNARAVETFPVTADCTMMSIVGVGTLAQKWPVVSVSDPGGVNTANPAVLVTADRVEISNLIFGGGTAAGAIHVGGGDGVWGTAIHDCFFGVGDDNAVGQDGIRVITGAAPYLTVYGCRFGHQLTRDGIRFDANATRCMIGVPGQPPNYFHNVPGICINAPGALTEPGVFDNVMALVSDTAGKAITFSATVADGWVHGNSAQFGSFVDMVANPYADAAGADANHWWNNIKGNGAQTYPA